MKPHRFPLTVLAGALALAPADAAVERRGSPVPIGGHRKLGLSAGALVGGGTATLSKPYGDLFGDIPVNAAGADRHPRVSFRGRGGAIASATPVRVREDFFIAEPQVNTVLPLTKWLHLDAGVGYRLIGGADLLNDDIRGVSGSIALQLGGR